MKFEFKDIPGYPDYSITSDGRVWSKERKVLGRWGNYRIKKGKWLKPDLSNSGYLRVGLWKDQASKKLSLHRLVLMTWDRLPEDWEQCDHINENKTDNRLENLRWVSAQQNCEFASAKAFMISFPDRRTGIFNNLKRWCRDNSIREDRIRETLTGRRNHYKGYKLFEI